MRLRYPAGYGDDDEYEEAQLMRTFRGCMRQLCDSELLRLLNQYALNNRSNLEYDRQETQTQSNTTETITVDVYSRILEFF